MRRLNLDPNLIHFNNPKYNEEETQIKLKELQEKISKLPFKRKAIWKHIAEYIDKKPRFVYLECDKCKHCGGMRTKIHHEKEYNCDMVHGAFGFLIFCPDCGNREFKVIQFYHS